MTVRLRPMREDEYAAFARASRDGYAEELRVNGGMAPADAEAKADADFAALLADGLGTPDAFLWTIEDAHGAAVGELWLGIEPDPAGGRHAFVYALEIAEHARRRGLGRAAMLALEDEVRALGLDRVELNVFGGNDAARALYASLGYREVAVRMAKRL